MKKLFALFIMAGATMAPAFSQHHDPSWSAKRVLIEKHGEPDSLCHILHSTGIFEGHVRTFFMSTVNHRNYTDYYGLAAGGGLGYYSPIIKGFQAGLSGFIIYNLSSSHLGPVAPFNNRYEVGLFDMEDPNNHEDLDRLEDLYLRYYFTKKNISFLQYGKFHLKTPLINLQDGRMRPNLQEGVWAEWNDWKKIKLKAGWINRTSPRSTVRWMDVGESLVYPNGRAVNGAKANYTGFVESKGVTVAGLVAMPAPGVEWHTWNYTADRLFNVWLQKVEWRHKKNGQTYFAGGMYAWQKSLFHDTLSVERQYIGLGEQSHAISARVGMQQPQHQREWSVSYTRITQHGRFLFPREWGIEPFYTFMQRERNEGAGDVHAWMAQFSQSLDKENNLSVLIANGIYHMPALDDARLNKYTMPSYYQLNGRIRYRFTGFLRGLNAELLYTYKSKLSKELEEVPANYHNKVNMHHLSVVMDYYF